MTVEWLPPPTTGTGNPRYFLFVWCWSGLEPILAVGSTEPLRGLDIGYQASKVLYQTHLWAVVKPSR